MHPDWRDEFAEQYTTEGGHATISECSTCGHLEWVSTALSAPKGHSFTPMAMTSCRKCDDVRKRDPELVLWVLRVIDQRLEKK